MNRGVSQLVAIIVAAIVIIGGGILLYQGEPKTETDVPTDDLITEDISEIDETDDNGSEVLTEEEPISDEKVDSIDSTEVVVPEILKEEVAEDKIVSEPAEEDTTPIDEPVLPEAPTVEEEPVAEAPKEEPQIEPATPHAETAYVINEADGTLSVIDVATETLTNTVEISEGGGGISGIHTIILSPDSTRFYISDHRADKVIVVNVSDLSVVTEITVGDTPNGLSTTLDGSKLYVANFLSDTVSVVDTSTYTVIKTIAVDRRPSDVSTTPDGNEVYVTHRYEGGGISDIARVLIIDTETDAVVSQINLPSSSRSRKTVFTPDGTKAFISIQKSDGVGIINTTNKFIVKTISSMLNVDHMVVSQNGDSLYVVSATDEVPGTTFPSKIYVINTELEKLARQLSGFRAPRGIAFSADGSKLYVTEYLNDEIRIFDLDADKVVGTISVGDAPRDIIIIPSS